jgi:hypothetical protein
VNGERHIRLGRSAFEPAEQIRLGEMSPAADDRRNSR